jgi:hypothetical protein
LLTLLLGVLGRVFSPWPLEWMEGASLQHALRLLRGEPLYATPSADFIAYLYPPLGYLPMALTTSVLGPTLPAARLASVACTLGTLWLTGRAASRLGTGPLAGLCAAGLFAMGYGYTGAFLDLARIDACFVLLIALGAERLSAGRTRAALVALGLSVFAKQHGLVLLLFVSLGLLRAREHRLAVATTWLGVLVTGLGLELHSQGYFSRYTLALPASHGLQPELLASYALVDVLLYLPVLALTAGVELSRRWPKLSELDLLLLAALLASALGRAHPGGHDNVRLPAFLLLCIVAVPRLVKPVLDSGTPARYLAALALQLAILWQSPSLHAPAPTSASEFQALREALRRCARGGPQVALDYALLGTEPFLHTMALSDLRMGPNSELSRQATDALITRLRSSAAPSAIVVGERFAELDRVLAERYEPCARVLSPRLATGYQPGLLEDGRRYQVVYAQKDLRAGP